MPNIRKRNGSYQITVSKGYDIHGNRLRETVTFTPDASLSARKQKKEAELFAGEFEKKILKGDPMDGRKITFAQFAERWMTEYAQQELQERTCKTYRELLDHHILPAIGHMKLTDIRPSRINTLLYSLTQDGVRRDGKPGGYSKASIKKVRNTISAIYRTAAEWELVERNPCTNVRIRCGDAADKVKFFTPEQAAIFLDYIEQPYTVKIKGHNRIDDTGKGYSVADYTTTKTVPEQLIILFNLAIYGGLRKGEIVALQWQDIDFENNTVHIARAALSGNGKQDVKAPKSKSSVRTVTIPQFLIDRLKKLQEDQEKRRSTAGPEWNEDGWVFTQEDGRMMNYYTPYEAMCDIIERYNEGKKKMNRLPQIGFHGLRHTCATLLIAGNQDMKTVSARMGHAMTSTTMDIYAHAMFITDQGASDTIEKMLHRK